MANEAMTPGDLKETRRIVSAILAKGFALSVHDGDSGWMIKRSTDCAAIMAELGAMEMDNVVIRDAQGEYLGTLAFIYGNADDGSEVLADFSAKTQEALDALEALWK